VGWPATWLGTENWVRRQDARSAITKQIILQAMRMPRPLPRRSECWLGGSPRKVSDRGIAAAPFIRLEGGGVAVKGKVIVLATVAAFVGPAEAVAYRGWDSTLDRSRESTPACLSERDPYALYGSRDYLPASYDLLIDTE
jgi:hypothetical protein